MAEQAQNTAQVTPQADANASTQKPLPADIKPEGTTAGTQTSGNEQPKPTDNKTVVSQQYELKLPDGSRLDKNRIEKVTALAKERGLSNEDAQKLLDHEHEVVSQHLDAILDRHKQQVNSWAGEIKSDKELGGEGYEKTVETAKRVIERFATPAFKQALNDTGFGNHPELVRVFSRIGKTMNEDQLVIPGTGAGSKGKSIEEIFYGASTN